MDCILRDIDIELWSKVKAEATLERKTMREVIFESLKWYIAPMDTATSPCKKKKGEKEGLRKAGDGCNMDGYDVGAKVRFRCGNMVSIR